MWPFSVHQTLHSQDLLVFKTSWRRLHHVFSVTVFRLPRRLQGVLQICLEDLWKTYLKTSWRRLRRRKTFTLITSWRSLEDMSWKRPEDVSETKKESLLEISVSNHGLLTNLENYVTNLYLANLFLTNLGWIRNALIRIQ